MWQSRVEIEHHSVANFDWIIMRSKQCTAKLQLRQDSYVLRRCTNPWPACTVCMSSTFNGSFALQCLERAKAFTMEYWGFLTGTVTCIFGVSMSEPHTTVVYRNTCIVRPTDQLCPSHSCDTDTFHVPMLPRHATLMCVVATRLRTPTMGKWKAETPAQQTVRLEWEISKPLHTCTSLSVSPSLAFMYEFFSLVTSHKPFSTFFLHDSSTPNKDCLHTPYEKFASVTRSFSKSLGGAWGRGYLSRMALVKWQLEWNITMNITVSAQSNSKDLHVEDHCMQVWNKNQIFPCAWL